MEEEGGAVEVPKRYARFTVRVRVTAIRLGLEYIV